MSKSFDWCINRVKRPGFSGYSNRNWNEAVELNTCDYLRTIFPKTEKFEEINSVIEVPLDDEKVTVNVSIKVNPDLSEYEYFTSASIIHDGTLIFELEAIQKALNKIIYAQTYNKNKCFVLRSGITISYEIGNIVCLHEYDGDFVPPTKP